MTMMMTFLTSLVLCLLSLPSFGLGLPQQLRTRETQQDAEVVTYISTINSSSSTTTAAAAAAATTTTSASPAAATSSSDVVSVVIIGAGAAGLSAAYSLEREGVDFIILESSNDIGGRAKTDTTFTNGEYPLDLGPSFIQFPNDILRILGRNDLTAIPSGGDPNPIFVGYSYHDFLKDYIAPKGDSASNILYGCRVESVDYSTDDVVTTVCQDGRTFQSQHAIVTVPLSILQDGDVIDFNPPLPTELTVGHPGFMWGGFKIILELTEDLASSAFCYGSCESVTGESFFWEFSSVNQRLANGNSLMMGYIAGDPAANPSFAMNDDDIAELVLDLLDEQFKGQARANYVKHLVVNWSKNPDIRGTWSSTGYGQEGAQNVNDKLWVAGEAFPIGERGWVDAAAFSGDDAAKQIVKLQKPETGINNGVSFWNKVADDLGRGRN